MSRYVILRHETGDAAHFDLMLESSGALMTWSIETLPKQGETVECRRLPDHRLAYLDYEGPVSGDRGSVVRWDRGTYSVIEASEDRHVVDVKGQRMQGRATLCHVASERWQLFWAV